MAATPSFDAPRVADAAPDADDGFLTDEDLDRVVGGLARPMHFPAELGRARPGDAALLTRLANESPR